MSDPFANVAAAADVMRGFPHPWWIAGGWAIDLFIGRVTREHADVEIGAFRHTQLDLRRHLGRAKFEFAHEGVWHEWEKDKHLADDVFQVRALNDGFPLRRRSPVLLRRPHAGWRLVLPPPPVDHAGGGAGHVRV